MSFASGEKNSYEDLLFKVIIGPGKQWDYLISLPGEIPGPPAALRGKKETFVRIRWSRTTRNVIPGRVWKDHKSAPPPSVEELKVLQMNSCELEVKILVPKVVVDQVAGDEFGNYCTAHFTVVTMMDKWRGTSERICLVKGRLNNIMAVIESIQDKIREKCADQAGNDAFDHKNTSRGSEIKIVMPKTSAEIVEHNSQEICDHYVAMIQFHPEVGSVEAKSALERVVTVTQSDPHALSEATACICEHLILELLNDEKTKTRGFTGFLLKFFKNLFD